MAQVAILLKVVLLTRIRPARTLVPLASLASTTLFSRQRSVVHGIITLSTTDTDGFFRGRPDCHNRCCRRTIQPMPCVQALAWFHLMAMAVRAPACRVQALPPTSSFVRCQHNLQESRENSVSSLLPPTPQQIGCASTTRAPLKLTNPCRVFVGDSRPSCQLQFQQWKLRVSCRTGPCLWPQAQSAQELNTVDHQVPLPAWVGPISHHQFKNSKRRVPRTPCLILGTTKVMKPKEAQFWSSSLVPRTWAQSISFTNAISQTLARPRTRSSAKKKQRRMFAVCFSPKVLASNSFSGHSFTYSTFNPLAVKKSADIFARQALERTSNRETPVSPLEGCP